MGRLLCHVNYKFGVVRVLLWSHSYRLTSVLELRVSRNWKKLYTNVKKSCQKRRNQTHQDSLWNSGYVHKQVEWILTDIWIIPVQFWYKVLDFDHHIVCLIFLKTVLLTLRLLSKVMHFYFLPWNFQIDGCIRPRFWNCMQAVAMRTEKNPVKV